MDDRTRISTIPCTVQILTRQSESTIGQCIEALNDFQDVMVLDAFSTDRTREIIQSFSNARLVDQPREFLDEDRRIVDFSSVRNHGIASARFDWIFVIDSNEVITPLMTEEVRTRVQNSPAVYQAFRRFYIHGEKIDWCSAYPAYQIRLFHRSCVDGYKKPVHERLILKEDVLPHVLTTELHENLPPYDVAIRKNAYYRLLERKRFQGISWRQWWSFVVVRNIRSIVGLAALTALIWIVPRKGKRMPLEHDYAYIRQQLLSIIEMSPLYARLYPPV
jgi:glycosyltransferase involved in cell wall biosynthesis